jgi:hypothetical protein
LPKPFVIPKLSRLLVLALIAALFAQIARAYSVLTHEQIVDIVWKEQIVGLLQQRYPGLTAEQLEEAHAHAYGGAVIQDLGYYPFGSRKFSDLLHYVRSGDFVRAMLRESRDANEYAFALGALAHYVSDINGHPAVNAAVAIEYPKLRAKYGDHVTYAEDRGAHLKTEFGFDVVQIAKGRYTGKQYHDFIGFQVSKPLLERVFPLVYGVELKDILAHEDLAIGSYRWGVSRAIPKMTQVALLTREPELTKEIPDFSRQKFLYRLSRADYQHDWGTGYQKPGFGTRLLAVLVKLIPHVGPFRGAAFKNPTPQTEDLYFASVNKTVELYRALLKDLAAGTAPPLPDRDFDTGGRTTPGEYSLTDQSYSRLVRTLAKQHFAGVTADLRANILAFYADSKAPDSRKRHRHEWQQVQRDVAALRATPVQAASNAPDR